MTVLENQRNIMHNTDRLSKVERALFGNGEPGMDEDVRNIKRDIATMRLT